MSLPGRFLNVGGHRVFCHRRNDAGPSAKPLVLLHGFLVSHWQWRQVIPTLAQTYDVIAIDFPGFGESDRPPPAAYHYDAPAFMDTVVGVLDTLGIERATLMGHSMGGGVALYTAARRPERVERVVAVDPGVYPFAVPLEGKLILAPLVGEALFRALYTRGIIRRYMVKSIYKDPSLASEEWIDYLWERVKRPGGYAAAHAALRFVSAPDVIARSVRAVRAPTLIVWGDEDALFPAALATRLQSDVAGSEIALIPVCGHAPPEERPDEFLAAIAPFLGLPAAHTNRAAG